MTDIEKFAVYLDSEEDFHSREFQREVDKLMDYLRIITGKQPARGSDQNIFLSDLTDEQIGLLWQFGGIGEIIPFEEYRRRHNGEES